MPISSTVAPATETITRLTTLIFSMFQTLKKRFIHDGERVDCFIARARRHQIAAHNQTGSVFASEGNVCLACSHGTALPCGRKCAQRPDKAGRLQQREGPRYSALINCLGRRLNGQEKAPAQD